MKSHLSLFVPLRCKIAQHRFPLTHLHLDTVDESFSTKLAVTYKMQEH